MTGMKFGTRKADAPPQGGNGIYMRAFPKGSTVVRFLEEPSEWILYYEHYTPDQKAFPCTMDTRSCPGCTSEIESMQRRSRKYGTFAYNNQWNDTVPYKLAMTLANRLIARAERQDPATITNRDYVVIRSGEGLRTEYDVDQEERYSVNTQELLSKASVSSVEEVLQAMFKEVWGDPEEYKSKDEYVEGRPPRQRDEDKDEVPDALKSKAEREHPGGVEEFKKEQDEVTESQLRAMSRAELEKVWATIGDQSAEDWSKAELLKAILDKAD